MEPSSAHALRILEIVEPILRYYRLIRPQDDFVHLARINRAFRMAVFAVFWRQPTREVFRPMLALTGDYHLKPAENERFTDGVQYPDPANWYTPSLQSIYSTIRVLRLDFATLRSEPILRAILDTAPAQFHLPKLTSLTISMDHITGHEELATRFLQSSIVDLSLLMFPPERPLRGRSLIPRFANEPMSVLEQRLEAAAATCWPFEQGPVGVVARLCTSVSERTPNLTRLQFVIASADYGKWSLDDFKKMVKSLKSLEVLTAARHTVAPPVLCSLSGHPSLRAFTAFQADFPPHAIKDLPVNFEEEQHFVDIWNLWGVKPEDMDDSLYIKPGCVAENLQVLHLEFDPAQFVEVIERWLEPEKGSVVQLTGVVSLSLICSTGQSGLEYDEQEIHDILDCIPQMFPSLKMLHVGPIVWNPSHFDFDQTPLHERRYRVSANTLRALTACAGLESLVLDTAYESEISVEEWDEILPSWPNLHTLLLRSKQPIYVKPPKAPLDRTLAAFTRHCPRITTLRIHATPVTMDPAANWVAPPMLRRLYAAMTVLPVQARQYMKNCDVLLTTLASRRGCAVARTHAYHYSQRPDLDVEHQAYIGENLVIEDGQDHMSE